MSTATCPTRPRSPCYYCRAVAAAAPTPPELGRLARVGARRAIPSSWTPRTSRPGSDHRYFPVEPGHPVDATARPTSRAPSRRWSSR